MSSAALLGILVAALLATSARADAQASPTGLAAHKGSIAIGGSTTSFKNPIFRHPGGGQEAPSDQSASTISLRASWFALAAERAALEVGLSYWSGSFNDFEYSDQFNQGTQRTTYGSPKESLVQADIALHYAPWTAVPLSVYGVLGMGSQKTDYTITNGAFADWNGAKSQSGFNYTYGLGTRLFAHRYLSLFAEYRWIPGDLVTEVTAGQVCWVTYTGGSSYSSCGSGSVPNKSTLLSLGAAIHIR